MIRLYVYVIQDTHHHLPSTPGVFHCFHLCFRFQHLKCHAMITVDTLRVKETKKEMDSLKAPLHDAIRTSGACRLPCTWANRKVWHATRMYRTDENGITARSIIEPILSHLLCDYPIRAQ